MEPPTTCDCGDGASSSTYVVNELYAYKVFVSRGTDASIAFATAIANIENGYNSCLIPFANSFLQNPTAWHEKYK